MPNLCRPNRPEGTRARYGTRRNRFNKSPRRTAHRRMLNLCQPRSNLCPPKSYSASVHIASVSAQISLCQPIPSGRYTCWRGIVSPCAKHRDSKRRRGSPNAPHRPYRGTRNIVGPHKHLTGGVRLTRCVNESCHELLSSCHQAGL